MGLSDFVLSGFALNVSNETGEVVTEVTSLTGNWRVLLMAIFLIVAALVLVYFLKQVVANAVVGLILLLVLRFGLGLPIPMTPLVLLISVLGGVGGVGAVLIASYLSWL